MAALPDCGFGAVVRGLATFAATWLAAAFFATFLSANAFTSDAHAMQLCKQGLSTASALHGTGSSARGDPHSARPTAAAIAGV